MREDICPRPEHSGLLIIDVQERLFPAMHAEAGERLLKATRALIEMSMIYEMPIVYTEQYPKGLGPTVEALKAPLAEIPKVEKTEFSALQNAEFQRWVMGDFPEDVILAGMETHVCVLQTAVDLLRHGYRVFVPQDAVASRTEENRRNGLDLMARAGAVITNTETLIFERLGKAGGDEFKRLSHLIR